MPQRRAGCCRATSRSESRAARRRRTSPSSTRTATGSPAPITLNGWFGTGHRRAGHRRAAQQPDGRLRDQPGAPNMWELVGAGANFSRAAQATAVEHDADLSRVRAAAWRSSAPRAAASFRPWCCSSTLNWMKGADAQGDRRRAPVPSPVSRRMPCWPRATRFTAEERHEDGAEGHGLRPWPETIGNMQVIAWD